MSKSNNKAIEEIREIWLKLTAKENEKHSCRCYNVFIFTFEHILLILLILTGFKYTSTRNCHFFSVNLLMHNIPKWSGKLEKNCSICCNILKVCLIILGHFALKA